jgi:uncharacterized protein
MTSTAPSTRAWLALVSAAALLLALLPVTATSASADEGGGLVISQVYGGGGNSGAPLNADFVELFNAGATTASLAGMSVQYASATGTGNFGATANQLVALPDLQVPAGGYVLVALAGGANGEPLPTPDVTGTINASAASGKFALAEGATSLGCNGGSTPCSPEQEARIVDLVGYGTANYFEGSGSAPQLSNTTAAFRLAGGCQDTDDNTADFVVGSPAPRTSATTPAPCDGSGEPEGPAQVLVNGSFEEPGLVGAPPVAWTPLSFENEGQPFNADVSLRSLSGQFPPPSPIPDGTYAVQVFWQSSSSTGVKGYGFEQTASSFRAEVDQDAAPTLSYAIAETATANAASTAWAGAFAEVEIVTSEGVELLRYFHPGTTSGGEPEDADGVTYVVSDPLVRGVWVSASHDLAADIEQLVGVEAYTVGAVRMGNLHERTDTSNFTNQTSYFDDVRLLADVEIDDSGPPPPPVCDVPEEGITRIHTIQGSGTSSPLVGQTVTVDAVVTLAEPGLGGFFLQEAPENEDGDPATSEGLFVATFSPPAGLEPGVSAQVTGTVAESFGRTQLTPSSIAVCDAREPVTIEPVELPLPSSPAERERFENMLVTASDLVVSGSFSAFQFGELVTGYQGELPSATEIAEPGPEAEAALADIKAREVILDDRSTASVFGRSIWDQDPERRLGDRIPEVTGVLDFTFGNFKIQYTEFPEFELFGQPEAPALELGNDIGAFNVLNYFNEFGSSSRLRGATNQADFEVQTAKIVSTILELDATVLGLIELQNDYLDEFDGDPDTEPSVATLVRALNDAAGEQRYDYVRIPEEQLATEGLNGGGVGTDAIANGIIYQPARATEVGTAATFDIDAELVGVTPDDAAKNRWPFAASFDIDGEVVTVVVNHFKSKGSNCLAVSGPDFDFGEDVTTDLTGSCDLTRQYAANQVLDWVDTDPTGVGDEDVFLVGDFNSYAKEAPIQVLEEAGYVNTVGVLGDGAFTYKFSGRVGTLDYIFASPSAWEKVDDAAVWQTNSRASYVDLYDVDPIDLTGPKGSSDHDPLVVSLRAPEAPTFDSIRDDVQQLLDEGLISQQLARLVVSTLDRAEGFVGGPLQRVAVAQLDALVLVIEEQADAAEAGARGPIGSQDPEALRALAASIAELADELR